MKVIHVVGARPNFMKVAPVFRALEARTNVDQCIVHTGQHYDREMSEIFFEELEIPNPAINLQVGSGTRAQHTGEVSRAFCRIAETHKPDLVIVYGDVNSTLAAALSCSKLGIKLAHVEAGLRSFDRTMPEEMNRVITDHLADLLFTPSQGANLNLLNEGIAAEKIHFVGNVMIDTLVKMLPRAQHHLAPDLPSRFALLTLHRPANVDDPEWLRTTLDALESAGDLPIFFPVHPRTRQRMADAGLNGPRRNLKLIEPLPYLSFLALQQRATVVITDSGGVQEETTYLGTPCITVRENTERPVTVELGTNVVVGRSPARLQEALADILRGKTKQAEGPPFWDGNASVRIADLLVREFPALRTKVPRDQQTMKCSSRSSALPQKDQLMPMRNVE